MYYIIIEIVVFVSIILVYLNNKKQRKRFKESEYTIFYEEAARITGVDKKEPFKINAERIIMKLQEKLSQKGHKSLYFISASKREESHTELPENISYYASKSERPISDDEDIFKDDDKEVFDNYP